MPRKHSLDTDRIIFMDAGQIIEESRPVHFFSRLATPARMRS
jgi:ABC-type polar amino acid transport system ATPase subunit